MSELQGLTDDSIRRLYNSIRDQVAKDAQSGSPHRFMGDTAKQQARAASRGNGPASPEVHADRVVVRRIKRWLLAESGLASPRPACAGEEFQAGWTVKQRLWQLRHDAPPARRRHNLQRQYL